MKLWHKKRVPGYSPELTERLHVSSIFSMNSTLKNGRWQWSWLNYLNATKY